MLAELRQEVYECLLELPKNRLVTMSSGTVSGLDPKTNLMVIKPSGYSYDKLTPEDLIVMDLNGKIILRQSLCGTVRVDEGPAGIWIDTPVLPPDLE